MTTPIRKTDIDTIAQAYFRDRANALQPFHSGYYPDGVNTGQLNAFSAAPNESVPSARGWLNGTLTGAQVRTSAINLGNYYSRLVRGVYGMHGNGASYSYGPDSGYIAFSSYDANNSWLNGSGSSFTMPLRLESYYPNYVAQHINNAVAANNMRLSGWVSGTTYTNNTWYDLARKNNKTVFGSIKFITSGSNIVGIHYRSATLSTNSGIFSVKDSAALAVESGTKAIHTTEVKNSLTQVGTPSGQPQQSQVVDIYRHAWNIIDSNISSKTVDLTVCHNSAGSGAGHSSRGRR